MVQPDPPAAEPVAPVVYAGFLTRAGATLIDSVVFIPIAVIVFIRSGLSPGGNLSTAVYNRSVSIILLVEVAYQLLLLGRLGQTLGDMALGIKVLRRADLAIPGYGRAAQRIATVMLLSLLPLVGVVAVALCYLWILWDPNGQGLHDKVARTVVVALRPTRYRPGPFRRPRLRPEGPAGAGPAA